MRFSRDFAQRFRSSRALLPFPPLAAFSALLCAMSLPQSLFNYNFQKIDEEQYQTSLKTEDEKLKIEMEIESESKKVVEKRRPGRPKKRIMPDIHDSSSSSSSSFASLSSESTETQTHQKRHYTDWFASPFIFEIVEEVRVWKSSRIAVENLQKRYPRMQYEPAGKFDDLRESTVRHWFDKDWTLKPQFAECVKAKHAGGRPRYFNDHIEEALVGILTKLRAKGKTVNSRVIALALKVAAKKLGVIVRDGEVSYQWCRNFVKDRMFWNWRSSTSGSKLPDNWKEQGIVMLKRVAVHIDDINHDPPLKDSFHRSLLINFDQTGVHLVPKSKHTYAATTKHHESVNAIGEDDKRQITAVMASSADGDLLPLQFIYEGKTQRCEAKSTSQVTAAEFHITHSQNHWSNLETMKQYIQKIIVPYVRKKIIQHSLPKESKAILLLDCWSVHRSEEFLAYMKAEHKNMICVFIPPNCTSKLQVADTHLNFPFKRGIRHRFNNYVVDEMLSGFQPEGADSEDEEIDLTMATLKPKVLQWCYETWAIMKSKPGFILNAWESLFSLFNPFSKENRDEAFREHAKDRWRLETKYDKAEDEEEENAYESESDDEEKDELDVMQEIRIGTRRSGRIRKQRENPQRQITSYMQYLIATDQIQLDEDEGGE